MNRLLGRQGQQPLAGPALQERREASGVKDTYCLSQAPILSLANPSEHSSQKVDICAVPAEIMRYQDIDLTVQCGLTALMSLPPCGNVSVISQMRMFSSENISVFSQMGMLLGKMWQ